MNKSVSFGRRTARAHTRAAFAPARPQPAAAAPKEVELTPEMRVLLFEGAAPLAPQQEKGAVADVAPPWRRGIGFVVSLAVACAVAGFTLIGRPQTPDPSAAPGSDPMKAVMAALDPDSRAVLAPAARWLGPAELAQEILLIGSNLGVALWLTHMIAGLFGVRSLPAVALIGAVLNLALIRLSSGLEVGEGPGLSVAALSGAGAAAFYRLLAGRRVT